MSKIVRYRFMGSWWWFWVLCVSGSDAIVQLIASNHEPEAALDYAGLEKKRDYLVAVLRAQQYAH